MEANESERAPRDPELPNGTQAAATLPGREHALPKVVPRMDAVQARAWIALVSTGQAVPAALDQQLTADAGLINFEYGILGALLLAPQRTLRMGDLAAVARSTAPRLSKAVSRLETRGLVERVACPDDGRAINVHLTREGHRTWLRATPPHIALARDTILAALTPEQQGTLAELLEAVLATLDADGVAHAARSEPTEGSHQGSRTRTSLLTGDDPRS